MKKLNLLSYKAVLNENHKGKVLSDGEIKSLQDTLVKCLGELVEVCDKYDIKVILQGGSLLGYVRHHGFIPWDDDLDVGMLRRDYEKFIEIFNQELSDRYWISAPKDKFPSYNRFVQIFRKGTELSDGDENRNACPQTIYIDIFPLDFAPNDTFKRWLKGMRANIFMGIGGCVDSAYFITEHLRQTMLASAKGKQLYIIRMLIGKLFSWRTPKKWFETIDKAVYGAKKTDFLTSGTGRWHYLNEVIPTETVLPLQKVKFEGIELYAPKNPDYYLKNNYGDYMKVPPMEKREKHFAVKLKTLE